MGSNEPTNRRKCILFVDDEQSIRRVGERALSQAGYEVLVAESGQQALELYALHSESVELVILDLSMPQMSGLDTFKELKRVRPDVRVVLSSGYDANDTAHQSNELHPVGFIQKPYRIAALVSKVQELVQDQE